MAAVQHPRSSVALVSIISTSERANLVTTSLHKKLIVLVILSRYDRDIGMFPSSKSELIQKRERSTLVLFQPSMSIVPHGYSW